MLTVEKIGGTSMTAFEDVLNNIILYKRKGKDLYNRLFVVSAYGGVTNLLLENKKTGEPGIYKNFENQKDYHNSLYNLIIRLKELNKNYEPLGLDVEKANEFIESRINDAKGYLDSMADVLASGYLQRENILLAAREILASIGESHSAFNSANILQNNGINTTLIDLSGFHEPDPLSIDERIAKSLKNIDFKNTICIITGYTKGTEGIMREFDRGYSEVTFSKVAVQVKAQEAIIHKEYHLSTADPNLVGEENCSPVGYTNYDVADQLADVGMEAIHPKASKPLEMNGINLRIKNTFEPDHSGTLISKEYQGPKKRVEVITGSDKMVIIDIHDPLMVGSVGFDLNVMSEFESYGVSYIYKTTSANSISLVIWEKDCKNEIIKSLESKYEEIIVKKVAMVCLIGTHIDQPGVLAKASKALGDSGVNILSAGFSLRQVNKQFIIDRENFKTAIIALNKAMYSENDNNVE